MATYQDYQQLSKDVYDNNGGENQIVIGNNVWNKVASTYKDNSGYIGAVYSNAKTKELIVVNQGTNPSYIPDDIADAQMAIFKAVPNQYVGARNLMQQAQAIAKENGYSISATGHSLGGSLAQLQGVEYNVPTVTFNAYGTQPLFADSGEGENILDHSSFLDLRNAYKNHIGSFNNLIDFSYGNDVIGNARISVGLMDNFPDSVGDIGSNYWARAEDTFWMADDEYLSFFGWSTTSESFLQNFLTDHGIDNFDCTKIKISDLCQKTFQDLVTAAKRDPLVLDLDGDGIEGTAIDQGVKFDMEGDGVKTRTGWVSGDDAFLALDRNNNSMIDSGAELFGDETVLASGQKAQDARAYN